MRIDAGAHRIAVTLKEGGRSFLSVVDDGIGMSPEELVLAVERHCTSKLPGDDLADIRTLGFRGEALPSIALGQPLHHHLAASRRRGGVEPRDRWRRQGRAQARRPSAGHAGRGARSFLCHAGPAEVPEGAAHRIGPCRRRHAPAGHGPSRHRLSPRKRRTHPDRPAGGQSVASAGRRCAAAGAAGRRSWAASSPTIPSPSTPTARASG